MHCELCKRAKWIDCGGCQLEKEFKSEPFIVETNSTLVKLRENKKNKKNNFIAVCLIKLVGESQCVFTAAVCQVQDSI